MPSWGVDLLALVVSYVVIFRSPTAALSAALGTAVIVPTTLTVPHTHFAQMTVQHVVAIMLVIRLARMVAHRDIRAASLVPGPALAALLTVLAFSFAFGVVFSASAGYVSGGSQRLIDLATQVVFFLGCLVLVRLLPSPWRAMTIAAAVVAISAGIAIIEHFTHGSFGHWIFSKLTAQKQTDAAHPLALRDNEQRVRAGAEFALEFAWVSVMLLPAFIVRAARVRNVSRWVAPALALLAAAEVTIAVFWSFSRSSLAAAGVAVVVLGVLARDRRLAGIALATVGAALVAYALVPSVSTHLRTTSTDVSLVARLHRLEPILGQVAQHPFRGLGLGNLLASGFRTTDNALLLNYVEIGVLGLLTLALLFLVVVVHTLRATFSARPDERPIAAACCVGAIAYVAAAQAYDAFTLIQAPQVLWFLVAVATVVAERGTAPVRLPVPRRRVVSGVALGGVAIGWLVFAVAPRHAAEDLVLKTLPATSDTAPYDTTYAGLQLVDTACQAATIEAASLRDVSIDCRPVDLSVGAGTLHVQAPTTGRVRTAVIDLVQTMRDRAGVQFLQAEPLGDAVVGRPSYAKTAPAWVPLFLLGLLLLIPWRRWPWPPLPTPRLVADAIPAALGR